MGDNTYNQYKCADPNYGRVEKCEIPGQFCFTSFTDWDGDGGMVQFIYVTAGQMNESVRKALAQLKEYSFEISPKWNYSLN